MEQLFQKTHKNRELFKIKTMAIPSAYYYLNRITDEFMRKMKIHNLKKFICLILCISIFPVSYGYDTKKYLSAGELENMCKQSEYICSVYFSGCGLGISATALSHGIYSKATGRNELKYDFLAYLAAHPDRRSDEAGSVMSDILIDRKILLIENMRDKK